MSTKGSAHDVRRSDYLPSSVHGAGSRRAFTLIELLVVIAFIGTHSSDVLASFNDARPKARDARRLQDIIQVQKAIEFYYSNNGQYPSTGGLSNTYWDPGCAAAPIAPDQKTAEWVPGLVPTYMSALPRDPLPKDRARNYSNTAACYLYASDGNGYVLSAWATVENGPNTTKLYSRAGFRETSITDQNYLCNHVNIGNPASGDYYQYSFTVTGGNLNCSW